VAHQRYSIEQKLDVGGMAEIFLAKAQSVGGIKKQVAIKRVLPNLTSNKRFVNMFLDEARLSMGLTHANIVQVFDVGRADGAYFIVMEYVDGYNLRHLLQRIVETSVEFPIHHAAHILMEACKGLAHAHERVDENGHPLGIVHRDVSPPNVLVSKHGEVKITDFGLAKAVTQLEITDPGIVKGKYSYLAPEAAEGEDVDHRADLFAVGILLWEILCKRRLFQGKNDMETVDLIRKAEVPSIQLFNKEVSDELEAIIMKALARDRRDRWPSARELCDALAHYLFSKNLKVTNYDIAESLANLFDEEAETKQEPYDKIEKLIEEEFISLSMIGKLPDRIDSEASRPLDEFDIAQDNEKHRFSAMEIWGDVAAEEIGGREDLALLVERLQQAEADEKTATENAAKKPSKPKRFLKIVIWLTLIGAAATGAAYFLRNIIMAGE